jgi:hypothetical protein
MALDGVIVYQHQLFLGIHNCKWAPWSEGACGPERGIVKIVCWFDWNIVYCDVKPILELHFAKVVAHEARGVVLMKRTPIALSSAATMFVSSASAFELPDVNKLRFTNECVKCCLKNANLRSYICISC